MTKQQRRDWMERNDQYIALLPPFPNWVGKCDDCGFNRLRLKWVGDRWTCEVCSPAIPWKVGQEDTQPCTTCPSSVRR